MVGWKDDKRVGKLVVWLACTKDGLWVVVMAYQ